MSKKSRWRKINIADRKVGQTPGLQPDAPVGLSEPPGSPIESSSPISPAQLAANRANAQLSTGPRTPEGKAASSKNAVKSALTGRTVLLPTDDVEEYAQFLADFQKDLKPVGQRECELVQIVVDCHWRLRRIQELEFALYAHGEEQFADAFPDTSAIERRSKIVLQTHLTYEKQLRNLHMQETRIDRKRAKALTELHELQSERRESEAENVNDREYCDMAQFDSEADYFSAVGGAYASPALAAQLDRAPEAQAGR